MTGQVQDKVVVVAGGSRGLGRAVSKLFSDEGAYVFPLARDKAKLEETAAECGPRAVPISTDLGDADSVRAAFDVVSAQHGKVDILLNVAGLGTPRRVDELTDDDVKRHVGANLLGPIYTTR